MAAVHLDKASIMAIANEVYSLMRNDASMCNRLLTQKEAAKMLGTSESTLKRCRKELPHIKGSSKHSRVLYQSNGLVEAFMTAKSK